MFLKTLFQCNIQHLHLTPFSLITPRAFVGLVKRFYYSRTALDRRHLNHLIDV